MKLCFNNLLMAFSDALDYIENDYFKIDLFHGKRVAYYSLLLGKAYKLSNEQLNDLIGCAFLHDNGLSIYYSLEDHQNIRLHCEKGENNVSKLPFFTDVHHVILYHHEQADGHGPFHKTVHEIPLLSQIIHIVNWVDVTFGFQNMNEHDYNQMIETLNQQRSYLFSSELIDRFCKTITYSKIQEAQKDLMNCFQKIRPHVIKDYQSLELLAICQLFTNIIDTKSYITKTHSIGVASKAAEIACHYKYSEDKVLKIFIAGAMHDLGKLVVKRDVLEKPSKLTNQEYTYMQTHAYHTYRLLNEMNLGDIVHWSSYHHEKLDGSGYPFGKKADQLDFVDRLIACCDIYQALREQRPYKEPINHQSAITIMRDMVNNGKIDGNIVEDMNRLFS